MQTGTPGVLIITSLGICFRQGHNLDSILFPTIAVGCKLDNSKTWGRTSWSARYGFVKQERKRVSYKTQQLQTKEAASCVLPHVVLLFVGQRLTTSAKSLAKLVYFSDFCIFAQLGPD